MSGSWFDSKTNSRSLSKSVFVTYVSKEVTESYGSRNGKKTMDQMCLRQFLQDCLVASWNHLGGEGPLKIIKSSH